MKGQRFYNLLISAATGLAVTGSLLLATAHDTQAAFKLRLSDGTTTKTITDSGLGDFAAETGKIKYLGGIGSFFINLTTGLSKPSLGSSSEPELQLSSVDVSSGAGGILTIMLTDTEFDTTATLANWVTTITGASSGTLSFEAYVNSDNTEFSTGQLVASRGPLTGLFSDLSDIVIVNPSAAFSVTLVATIAHDGGFQATGFRANVSDPPLTISEPRTLALFGIGLLGLGMLMLWRRQTGAPSRDALFN